MDSPQPSKPRSRGAALLAAAAGILAYANTVANEFAYDDHPIVVGNEDIHALRSLPGTFWEPYWPSGHGRELGLWRPVATLVHGVQWALWGGDAAGFHAVNVGLNGLAAALVVLLLRHLMPAGAALTAGLLFAVHPVHTEAVANVVGMAELLTAVLYLAACLLVVRNPGRMRPGALLATVMCFLAAVLTKESAITLPATVLLLDCARRDPRVLQLHGYLAERGALLGALAVAAALVCAGRVVVLGSVADPLPPLGAEVLASGAVPRVWTVMGTWPAVFRLLFLPLDLSADYAPGVVALAYGWTTEGVLGVLMGLGALCVAWIAWRAGDMNPRRLAVRSAGFGILWFVITFLPASNLVFLTGVLLAERTLYLPSVGFAAAAGWMLAEIRFRRPWIGSAAMAVILAVFLVRTVDRNPVWRDNAAVFSTLIHQHPESGRAQWLLGDLHFARGDHPRGLAAYRRAIGLLGGSYALLAEMGRRLNAAGHERAGEHVLRSAWRGHPDLGPAPALLAILYDRQERWVLAEEAARAALEAEPANAVHAHLLARSLEAQRRHREALGARRMAIRLGEDHPRQRQWLAALERRVGGPRRRHDEPDRSNDPTTISERHIK